MIVFVPSKLEKTLDKELEIQQSRGRSPLSEFWHAEVCPSVIIRRTPLAVKGVYAAVWLYQLEPLFQRNQRSIQSSEPRGEAEARVLHAY